MKWSSRRRSAPCADKTARVVKLSARLTSAAGIEAAEMRDIARSAYLAKADLVTSAVIEFTSVQGIMGSYYATAAGEPPRVAAPSPSTTAALLRRRHSHRHHRPGGGALR